MADIGNQLTDLEGGLERFLDALDKASFKMGSNAALEASQARAAFKIADQEKRFKKKLKKIEEKSAKEMAQAQEAHAKQIKSMQPLYKKMASAIGQEIKTKSAWLKKEIKTKSDWLKKEIKDKATLLRQVKGLGNAFGATGSALKKTASRIDTVFKALGKGIAGALKGLGAGFKGGIAAGLGGVLDKLESIQIMGISVGKIIGAIAASAKLLYEIFSTNEKMMADITKQTAIMGDTFKKGFKAEVKTTFGILGNYGYTLKETLKLTQDMREAFGDVSYVTSDLIKKSAELQMVFRIPADDANELVESITRIGYDSDKFLKTMESTAIVMGADVGMAMRDVAKNTQMVELYAGRGEEYFARMASRAALLGTNMQSIEDSGKAFEDFDQMAENMNVTAQLFGAGFEDGLKSLTDMRMMYERGDMLGIQEHIAQQAAKTLYYEDGKLKSLKTQDILYQSQIKQLAQATGMDNVSALRAIKSAKMMEMMNKTTAGTFKIEENMLKTEESKELLAASRFDYSMAMFSALRDAGKDEKYIVDMLSTQGKTIEKQKKDRLELVKIAEDEMEKRAKTVEEQLGMEQKTLDAMTALQKALASMNKNFEQMMQEGGEELDKVFGDAFKKIPQITDKVFEGMKEGLSKFSSDQSVIDNIEDVFTPALKGGIVAMFDDVTPAMLRDKGLWDTFEFGFVKALGGAAGKEGIWDIMTTKIEGAWDYGVDKFWEMAYFLEDMFDKIGTEIGIKINSALDDLPFFEKYTEQQEAALREAVNVRTERREYERKFGDKEKIKKFQEEEMEKSGMDASVLQHIGFEDLRDLGAGGYLENDEPQSLDKISKTIADAHIQDKLRDDKLINLKTISDAGRLNYDEWYNTALGKPFRDRLNAVYLDKNLGILDKRPHLEPIRAEAHAAYDQWVKDAGYARGISGGGMHRGIVGEAGTEVGITKNALKELSSIGVPSYAEGRGGTRRSMVYSDEAREAERYINRELLYRSRGGVDSRADRAADNKRMRELIVKPQREFLERQRHLNDNFLKGLFDVEEEGITKGHVIWAQGVKEFFTQYPALIDRVIGEPFRQGGAVSEGIYKSVFSGLQAYSRAELAGASKKEARQKMVQHMLAEGVREGGIIDQGFVKLRKKTDLQTYAIQGGAAKEEKARVEMHIQNEEIRKKLDQQHTSTENSARLAVLQSEKTIETLEKNRDTARRTARQAASKELIAANDQMKKQFEMERLGALREAEIAQREIEQERQSQTQRAAAAEATILEIAKSREATVEADRAQFKKVSELVEISKTSKGVLIAQNSLLVGLQTGLVGAIASVIGGGSRKDALERGAKTFLAGTVTQLATTLRGDIGTGEGEVDIDEYLGAYREMGPLVDAMLGGVETSFKNVDWSKTAEEMLNEGLRRSDVAFRDQGYGMDWNSVDWNAKGRVYDSPHLTMVGEGSQNEVIIPTERIRKGLPINKGVANELASIGVPGFAKGGLVGGSGKGKPISKNTATRLESIGVPGYYEGYGRDYTPSYSLPANLTNLRGLITPAAGATLPIGNIGSSPGFMDKIGRFLGGKGTASQAVSGGLITSGLQFGVALAQGGDMRSAAFDAIGAGVGYGATVALSAIPGVGPFIGPILGPMIGNLAGKGLNKLFGKKPPKPKYGKYRQQALKNIEEHVQTRGMFGFGQPSGVKEQIQKALTGSQKNKPSDKEQQKLVEAVADSKFIGYGLRGPVGPEQFLALLGGAVTDSRHAMAMYDSLNQSFYGRSAHTSPVMMAEGGIVTRPTHAIIGEAGPEAVIPLNRTQQYSDLDQKKDNDEMITELKKQNQQMSFLIRKMGDAKTVLNVDGRQLAESIGVAAFDINNGQ